MAKQLAHEPDEAALYESDFYTWCMREARLLREGRLAELDLPNLAEEIASLGNEQEHALGSSLRILLVAPPEVALSGEAADPELGGHDRAGARQLRERLRRTLA